ncbi:hypothetical protein ACE38W_13270 [Chitinophaga sp. Hz27]|uniref:hypothetical protein n=1 Tax=Chitinophaga sp. Hz27 TaxID=3347169 RepID=UPI0035DE55C9
MFLYSKAMYLMLCILLITKVAAAYSYHNLQPNHVILVKRTDTIPAYQDMNTSTCNIEMDVRQSRINDFVAKLLAKHDRRLKDKDNQALTTFIKNVFENTAGSGSAVYELAELGINDRVYISIDTYEAVNTERALGTFMYIEESEKVYTHKGKDHSSSTKNQGQATHEWKNIAAKLMIKVSVTYEGRGFFDKDKRDEQSIVFKTDATFDRRN